VTHDAIGPVRWGILSTAAINERVIRDCKDSSDVDFVGIASRSASSAEQAAVGYGINRGYDSYEALLSDPDIEAVYIPVPNRLHVEWAVRALDAGKHVLCEKPLSATREGASTAFDASERNQRLLVEAFMWRFHPQTSAVRQLVAEGRIGDLRLVRSTLTFPLADLADDVRMDPALDGGALMDVGCYCLSAFRLFAGEPTATNVIAELGPTGVDVRAVGLLDGPNGVIGQFDCGMTLPRRDELQLVGTRGVISVPDPWHCRGDAVTVISSGIREELRVPLADAYRVQFETVSRCIREGSKPEWGRHDAEAQALLLDQLRRQAGVRTA
jgi:xylose dehydrogenase (NAD/NADP)